MLHIVLFGGTGDLSRKKLLPALFYLFEKNMLPPFEIIAVARQQLTTEEYWQKLTATSVRTDPALWQAFLQRVVYVSGDSDDDQIYQQLRSRWSSQDKDSCLFYLATLPHLYGRIAHQLHAHGLTKRSEGWSRLLVEKPFGVDLVSSRQLNSELLSAFPENDIFRIDHYLAKETMQNIIAFRFANGVFEHLWNSQFIDHIQVTNGETIGVEGRERFYNDVGVVRDVVQNHVLSLLAISLMEEPASLEPKAIQRERLRLLSQIEVLNDLSVAGRAEFGQYEHDGQAGTTLLSPTVPTAVAARFSIGNPRWNGVPVYIRAGKKLASQVTELSIVFKEPINRMFRGVITRQQPNVLTFRIQPNEGVILSLNVKQPGFEYEIEPAPMSFCYASAFTDAQLPEAYSKVIYDAIKGDLTLFLDEQGVDASWAAVQPLLDYQASLNKLPDRYQSATWGPESFQQLIARDGRQWLTPDMGACSLR